MYVREREREREREIKQTYVCLHIQDIYVTDLQDKELWLCVLLVLQLV